MSKFIGLVTNNNECVIVNINSINSFNVEKGIIHFDNGNIITLNNNSIKFLVKILMENEYKLRSDAE